MSPSAEQHKPAANAMRLTQDTADTIKQRKKSVRKAQS